MIPKSKFVTLSAPGLPPWPPLLLDSVNRRAVVSARLTTWNSVEAARIACGGLWIFVAAWVSHLVWLDASTRWVKAEAVIVTIMATPIISLMALPLIQASFRGFFARQMFCTRVKVWFRPDAIAFRSHLYSRPVVLWRKWKGMPVQCRFEVTKDLEAAAQSKASSHPKQMNHNVATACLLRIIVETSNPHRSVPTLQQPICVRAIPIVEIDVRDAQRLAIVLTTAASLTHSKPDEYDGTDQQTSGVDIDVD